MDQAQKRGGRSPHWNSPFPTEKNTRSQSASGRAVDGNTSVQGHSLKPSYLDLLARFGLSNEDLEKLSQYPDDQLTPENIPFLLQAIRKPKLAPKVPSVPSESILKARFGVSSEDLEKLSQYPDDQLTPENIPFLLQAIRKPKPAFKVSAVPSKSTEKASFGLSIEDLEKLSQYPDDQLTPDNILFLLQAIRKPKLAPKVPSKSTEKETLSHADGCGTTVQTTVIDYGHKSKYGYNEGPLEGKTSTLVAEESTEGFQTHQPASAPSAPSSLISSPKNPSKELIRQLGSQTSTRNPQAFPPVDPAPKAPSAELRVKATVPPANPPAVQPTPQPAKPPLVPPVINKAATNQHPPPFAPVQVETVCGRNIFELTPRAGPPNLPCQAAGGQNYFRKEAKDPIRSPFGVVKASWLPSFPPTDQPKLSKLPSPSEMNDYNAVTPRMFPHVCSLCNEDCKDKMDWMHHQNTILHIENCRWLLQKHPEWTPEAPSSLKRCKDGRQERHQSRQRSVSLSPTRSRRSSSSHARHRSRSWSRSPRRKDNRKERHQSRQRSVSLSPTRSRRSSSSHARHRSRSWSRSPRRKDNRKERHQSRQRSVSLSPTRSRRSSSSHARHRSRSWSRSPRRKDNRKERHQSRQRSVSLSPTRSRRSSSSHARHRSRSWSRSPRCRDDRKERYQSSQRSASPSPKRSRRSSSSHARHRTRSRSRSPRCKDGRQERRQSRQRTFSPSPTHSRHSSSSHRTRSPSRSPRYHRRSRSRSRSPRHFPSSWQRSRAPRQYQHSSGWFWHSSSKERGSGNSTRSTEGRHAMAPFSPKGNDEWKRTPSSSFCGEKRHEDSGRMKEGTPRQRPSADEAGSQEQTHEEREPEGRLHEKPELLALASLTEKSVLQAMAQLQGQGAAGGGLSQGGSSVELAAGVSGTSTVSSDLLSMIQRVTTQVITAVLDSKEASTTQASTSGRVRNPRNVNTATGEKAKSQSVGSPGPKPMASAGSKATVKRAGGLGPQVDPAKRTKAKGKSPGSLCLKKDTSLSSKAKSKEGPGLCPKEDKAKSQPDVGACPEEETSLSITAKNKPVVSPRVQLGTVASGKEANERGVGPGPEQGVALRDKSANDSGIGLAPHPGTPDSGKAENHGLVAACPQQGPAASSKSDNQGVASRSLSEGTSLSSKAKKKEGAGLCPKEDKAKSQPEAGACPEEETSLSSRAKNKPVVSPHGQLGTVASGKKENECAVDPGPEQGVASSDKAANDSKIGLTPHSGTPGSGMAENQGLVVACPQQGTAASSKSDNQSVASRSLSEGTSLSSKAKNKEGTGLCPKEDKAKSQPKAGACPEEETSLSITAKNKPVVSPRVQLGTVASGKEDNECGVGPGPEQGVALRDKSANDSGIGLAPHPGTPDSGKAENHGLVAACPQQGPAANSKSDNQGVASRSLSEGTSLSSKAKSKEGASLCPKKDKAKSQPKAGACPEEETSLSSRAKNKPVVSPRVQLGTVASGKEQNKCAVDPGPEQSVALSDKEANDSGIGLAPHPGTANSGKAETQGVAGACTQQGTAASSKSDNQSVASCSLSEGTSLSSKAKSKEGASLCPKKDKAKSQPKAGACPEEETSLSSRAKNKPVVSPCVQLGTVASGKKENECAVDPGPEQGVASSDKAANDSKIGLTPYSGTPDSGMAENQDLVVACPQQGTAASSKSDNQSVASRSLSEGTSLSSKAKSKEGPGLCPKEDKAKSQPDVGACLEEETSLSITAKNKPVVSPRVQLGTVASGKEENECGVDPGPEQGIALRDKSTNDSGIGLAPHPGTPDSGMVENQGVAGACPQQGTAVSSKSDNQGVASRNLSEGTSLSSKAKRKEGAGLCPKEDKAKSQPDSGACSEEETSLCSTAKNKPVVSPRVQLGTVASGKEQNKCGVDPGPERGIASSDKAVNDSGIGLAPHPGTADSGKAENQGVAGACPQQGTAASSKSDNQSMASCSPSEGAAGEGEAESLHVADPDPSQGTAASCETESKCLVVPSSQQDIVPNSKAASQGTELALVPGNIRPCSVSPGQVSKPRVHICGDSLVVSAQKRASSGTVGLQLGLEEAVVLEWHGQENMTWTQLVPTTQNLATRGQSPDVFIIHLEFDVLSVVKRELSLLRGLFPQAKVIWSEIIPRGTCHGVERVGQWGKMNTAMGQHVKSHGGAVIKHPRISPKDPELFTGKATLSNAGLDIFLEDIKNGIRAHVLQSNEAAGGGLSEGVSLPPPATPAAVAGLGCVSQGDEAVSSSEEASSMRTNIGEAAVSPQPVSSKAVNFGVAIPSPQPGTSGTCKIENQVGEQKQVTGSAPHSRSPGQAAKLRIWICGHGVVAAARERAASASIGSQLGLEESVVLEWHGREGLKWEELLPFLQNLATQRQPPDVLIIHLGEDDLAHALECDLIDRVKKQFFLLRKSFATVKVLWSEMMPLGTWHGGERGMKRTQVNSTLEQCLKLLGSGVIKHPERSSEDPELYIDKANLSNASLDMFLEDIKNGIVAQVLQPSREASGRCNERINLHPPVPRSAPAGLASVSREVATREEEVLSSSEEASDMQRNRGQAAVSPQPVSSKVENCGVACPSPQPGTSGSCKAKKQDVEQERVDGSIPPCTGTREQVTKPRVWICGDSLVVSAQKWALQKSQLGGWDGLQQGVAVEWHGQEGMTWTQLVPTLQDLAAQHQPPDVLIVHLGEKELLYTPWRLLCRIIQIEVFFLKEVFPKVRLIWSEMLPQKTCPAVGEACEFEKVLQRVNLAVGKCFGGAVIKHVETSNSSHALKVHTGGLSPIGLDLFLENIKNGIRAHVPQSSRAAGGGLHAGWRVPRLAPLAPPAGLGSVSQETARQGEPAVPFSEEASQMQDNVGGAALSSQPAACVHRREKMQTVRQQFAFGSFHFHLGSVRPDSKPRVWICGESVVVSAQKRVSSTAAGSHLGMEQSVTVEWHGQDNLKWLQLLPFLQNRVTCRQAPDVLIIHLGEKALAGAMKHYLVNRVKAELFLLTKLFPQVRMIWSEIIPQGIWSGEKGDLTRRRMNTEIVKCVKSCGGAMIKHPRISSKDPELYIDEANLSPSGLDIFLEDIKNGILAHVLHSSEAAGGGIKESMHIPPPASPVAGLEYSIQEVATEVDETVSSSEEASSMQMNSGEAAVSSQPVSNKAENSGVASPSPQPGTSGTCKTENQDEEQRLVVRSVHLCPGSPGRAAKTHIWICGHGVVALAQERAASTRRGFQLGLEESIVLEWHGRPGLTWVGFIPLLQDLASYLWAPDVLIIHLGENDLEYTLYVDSLIKTVKRELLLLKELFPNVKVIWSDIMPWGNIPDLATATDKHRVLKKANTAVGQSVKDDGGGVIKHPRISSHDPELFLDNGTLSDAGLDVFLKDIKKGIHAHILRSSQATGSRLNKGVSLSPPASRAALPGLGSLGQEISAQVEEAVSSSEEASCMQTATGEAAVSPQPVSCKAENSGMACPSPQLGMSGSCKTDEEDQELVDGSVPPYPGEATVSSQPKSSKAENSGVASPSPHPGMSGTCKTENLDKEQKWVVGCVLPCPGSPGWTAKPHVWIYGHGVIALAQERAASTSKGSQLGLEERVVLEWHGRPGLTWVEFIPVLEDLAFYHWAPDVLIIHLGENDLKYTIYVDFLIKTVKRELLLLKELFPNVKVIWSDIMPWGNISGARATDKHRVLKKANTAVGQSVKDDGGAVIEHPRISFQNPELFTDNGTLSDAGLDIFLEDITNGIRFNVLQSSQATGGRLNKGMSLSPPASQTALPGLGSVSQEISAQAEEAVSTSVEASSMRTNTVEAAVCPQPVSGKAENSGMACPSPQQGTPGSCKTEKEDLKQELVDGSVPPCLGENAVNSQPESSKRENFRAASPSPQPGMSGTCKTESLVIEQEGAVGCVPICPGEATVSSQPKSSKGENSGAASPSPQLGASGSCKTEKEDEVVDGSVPPCSGENAVNSQPESSKRENFRAASPSPQPGMSGTCETESLVIEQEGAVGCVPICPGEDAVISKAENSHMASPSPLPGMSGSCTTEKEDVEQDLVDGSIPPCPGEDADSSQPMRSKAEYSHTYSPNPQPGMSRSCKIEKEDLEQELVDGSVLSHCSGNPKEASKQRVWICGQSVVIAAEKQASSSEAGSQLGLEEGFILEWHGQEDLSWTQLVPTLQNLAAENQAPDVLIVHLGENDLECSRGAELSCTIKKELVLVKELFPQVRILWSNVLLRRRGFGKAGSRTVNRARTMVNLELGQFISTLGGAAIEHPAILHTDPDFYIDGENLSCRGLDIFLEDIKNGILAHLHS